MQKILHHIEPGLVEAWGALIRGNRTENLLTIALNAEESSFRRQPLLPFLIKIEQL